MRIQHNVMAMNAYRNYSNNTKALSKNLERLSSGYKINRAGDDAAGLAISEKMRAQITGLEAAQKNVKDGISLVNTAEGAMQEVQDMLNRMVYLAQESANGTYDNEVDRLNLQKEMDQLNDEIDRIADSANFNGLKLLNGNLDANGVVHGTGSTSELVNFSVQSATGTGLSKIPAVGSTLGTSTILHAGATDPTATGTEFSVDLHDVKFDAREGDVLTIKLGDGNTANGGATITLTALKTADAPLTGQAIVEKILAGTTTDYDVKVNGTAFNANDKVAIKGSDFSLLDTGQTTGRLAFRQDKVPASNTNAVLGNMAVAVSSTVGSGITGNITTATVAVDTAPSDTAAGKYSYDLTGITDIGKGTYNVNIGGKTVAIELTNDDNDADAVASKIADAINAGDGFLDGIGTGTKYTVAANGSKIVFTASGTENSTATPPVVTTPIAGNIAITPATTRTAAFKGDYNVSTTDIKNVAAAGAERLASTVITLENKMIAPGGSIYIGNQHYTFSTDDSAKDNSGNKVYIGDMVDADGKIDTTKLDLTEVARRLTDSAKDNAVWTVGKAGDTGGKITLVEKTDGTGTSTGNAAAKAANGLDLSTEAGIAKSLGYKGLDVAPTAGNALTLQIGDTSDDYNQLKVNIQDIHSDKLGTRALSVATQAGAAAAVDKIKDAINTISGIRGTLGATSNRLDHTANNLSVMRENITDAESAIRDTDIAEEMMAYTKNNILVQSAQAMLAQANQVPQGVLQLLQ